MNNIKDKFIEKILKKVEEMYFYEFNNNDDNTHLNFIKSIGKESQFNDYLITNFNEEKKNVMSFLDKILDINFSKNYCICDASENDFYISNNNLLFSLSNNNIYIGYKNLDFTYLEFNLSSDYIKLNISYENQKNKIIYKILDNVLNSKNSINLSYFELEHQLFEHYKKNFIFIYEQIKKLPPSIIKSLSDKDFFNIKKEDLDLIKLTHDQDIGHVISTIKEFINIKKNEKKIII